MPTPLNSGVRSQLKSGVNRASQVGSPGLKTGAQAPTTLSSAAGAAGTMAPSSGKRTGLIAGAALVTVALGIGIFVAASSGGGDKGSAPMPVTPAGPPTPVEVAKPTPAEVIKPTPAEVIKPTEVKPDLAAKPEAGSGAGSAVAAGSGSATPSTGTGSGSDAVAVKPADGKPVDGATDPTVAANTPKHVHFKPVVKVVKPGGKPGDKPKDPGAKPPGLPSLPSEL
jgi:hypothetical protein